MKPHLFKSRLIPSKWVCCAKTLDDTGSRVYKPLPEAELTYGRTPAEAYKEWVEYFAPGGKEP